MAELILTDEEKAALTWLELDDATVGKVTKKLAARLLDVDKELDRLQFSAAVMILVGHADDANAETLEHTLHGYTRKGVNRGDWKLTIQRLPSNDGGNPRHD